MTKYSKLMLAAAISTLGPQAVNAAPTAEEAAQLGKTLTAFGAIKAGNSEGTIPEWGGGVCTPPAGYKPAKTDPDGNPSGGPYVDPFATDKPLFKITAANLDKYADKLDEGTKELFRRYPQSYFVSVYPTRRSACFSNWMYDNTIKRVMSPKIVGDIPSLTGAHAQIPFPIPKTGVEAMWNTALKPEPVDTQFNMSTWLIDSSGGNTLLTVQTVYNQNLYWDNSKTSVPENKPYWPLLAAVKAPAAQAGGMQMLHKYLRPDLKGAPAWSYIPGQRRVRLAPEFSYDGVSSSSAGILLYDESNGFDGNMDRFDFKLVGRKEMLIPYNAYEYWNASVDQLHKPDHHEPNALRFELHRVWVVEATLKPGERHVQSKKVFYIDEDSWNMVLMTGFDQIGKVHHLIYLPTIQTYDKPEVRNTDRIQYDFAKRAYLHSNKLTGDARGAELYGTIKVKPFSENFFTPAALSGMGLR